MRSIFESKDLKSSGLWLIQCSSHTGNNASHIRNAQVQICGSCYQYSQHCEIEGLREYISTVNECCHMMRARSLQSTYSIAFTKYVSRLERSDHFFLASKVLHSLVEQAYSDWIKKQNSISFSVQASGDENSVLLFSEFLEKQVTRFCNNFDISNIWGEDFSNDDAEESYSVFISALCHSGHILMDSTDERYFDEEDFVRSILRVISSDCWKLIVKICDIYSISVQCQTPLITEAIEWLKGLNSSEIAHVCGDPNWQVIIKESYEYLSDVYVNNGSSTHSQQQRHINRLIQTLQMATTADEIISNPFASWAFRGLILSPILQPSFRKDKDLFLEQSCLPNTEVRINIEEQILQLHLKLTRDISENENLSFNFGCRSIFPCHCLRCLSRPQLLELFSETLLPQLVSWPDLRDSLRRLFTCFSSPTILNNNNCCKTIPQWQCELRTISDQLDEDKIKLLPYNHPKYQHGNWLQWRSFADFLASSSVQLVGPAGISQLSGSIAIYFLLLFEAVNFPYESRALQSKTEVSLSLVAAILEILTQQAQSSKSSHHRLCLQFGSKKEELVLLNFIAKVALEGCQDLDNSAAASLRNILTKLNAFQPLTSITPVVDFCDSDSSKILDIVSDSGECMVAAISPNVIFTPDECQKIIMDAENIAAKSKTGWTTSRHYSVPTTDIPITMLSEDVQQTILEKFSTALLPFQFHTFSHTTTAAPFGAFVFDLFVVKYNAEPSEVDAKTVDATSNVHQSHASIASRQRFLPLHRDQSAHSAVVSLNQSGCDFTGGGTYIPALVHESASSAVVFPDVGKALTFSGNLLHSGDAVLTGCRYIIAAFFVLFEINDDATCEEETARYCDNSQRKRNFQTMTTDNSTFSFSFF